MDARDSGELARAVFAGLAPSDAVRDLAEREDERQAAAARRRRRGVNLTLPVMLAGAMTVTMNVTAPLQTADAVVKKPLKTRSEPAKASLPRATAAPATAAAATSPARTTTAALSVPSRYTVVTGDSVSTIAERYGLSTAAVLALNGLSWKSLIFPGQVLRLSAGAATPAPTPVAAVTPIGNRYTIQRGDTISSIAQRFGVSTQSVLTANRLSFSSIIYPGQAITIPGGNAPALDVQTVSSVTSLPAGPTTPVVSAPTSTRYTIRTGDTVSSIARSFGVTTTAILQANGLGAGSIIYAGRTLNIPGAAAPQPAAASADVTPLTAETAANARIIVSVGRQLGVSDRGIVIALATAMQESGLRNLDYGDRDSIGVFQQRPSTGWGTEAQLLDVSYAARLFYGGPSNPNKGNTRGLLDIPGWTSMTLAQAAQAVQISAYPDAYATWETSAKSWLSQLS